jgi:hypothetical protein
MFREVITMKYQKTFVAGGMALMLAISATAARGQSARWSGVGSTVSAQSADPITPGALGSPSGQISNDFPVTTYPDAAINMPQPPDTVSNPPPGFGFPSVPGPDFSSPALPAFPSSGFPAIGGSLPSFGRR